MELFERAVETAGHTVRMGDEIVEPHGEVLAIVEDPYFLGGPQTYTYTANGEAGHYTVQLGLAITDNFRPKTIRWQYQLRINGELETIETAEEPLQVVRPYISINEYNRGAQPQDGLLYSDFKRLESTARKVIESYTRQSFQLRERQAVTVTGGGTNALQLPDRLVALDNIVVADETFDVSARPSDYSIMNYAIFDPSSPWQIRKRASGISSPSINPIYRHEFFKNGQTYIVTGTWGWPDVPQDVAAATALLIRDYSDDDALYREKYITVIRAADWRMEFGATGMETTGNANADMMLEKFRNYRPEII